VVVDLAEGGHAQDGDIDRLGERTLEGGREAGRRIAGRVLVIQAQPEGAIAVQEVDAELPRPISR